MINATGDEHAAPGGGGGCTRQQRDTNGDGLIDEDTDYVYDANDRLRTESVDTDGDGQYDEKVTVYGYGPNDTGTQQTSKQIWRVRSVAAVDCSADLRGNERGVYRCSG